jgi:serine O-acetyltransferase
MRSEAIWATAVYRFGQYLEQEAPTVVRILLRFPYSILQRLIEWLVGINLPPKAQIGPGLYIAHYGGIWINPHVKMGENCNIAPHVTIGIAGSTNRGAPIIGDRVWIGPKATVNGPLHIGSGAVISPNSLVVTHVPENAVVIGVPAKIMSYTGSAKLINVPLEES